MAAARKAKNYDSSHPGVLVKVAEKDTGAEGEARPDAGARLDLRVAKPLSDGAEEEQKMDRPESPKSALLASDSLLTSEEAFAEGEHQEREGKRVQRATPLRQFFFGEEASASTATALGLRQDRSELTGGTPKTSELRRRKKEAAVSQSSASTTRLGVRLEKRTRQSNLRNTALKKGSEVSGW